MNKENRLDVAYYSYLAARAERDRLWDAYNVTSSEYDWLAYLQADAAARGAAEIYSAADSERKATTAALRAVLAAARAAEIVALGVWENAEANYNTARAAVEVARAAVEDATRAAVE